MLTQHRERGKVAVVKERGRTADVRVVKAELHPPHEINLFRKPKLGPKT